MRDYFIENIRKALVAAGIETERDIQIEKPADNRFGDFSTNIALVLAKERKENRNRGSGIHQLLSRAGIYHAAARTGYQ